VLRLARYSFACGVSAGGRWETGVVCGQDRQQKNLICRMFSTGATGLEPRDLRRDRPNRAQRRPAPNVSERPHLRALSAQKRPPLRMVEPVVESTFGPRVGHE